MNASLQAVIAATKFSPSLITPKASGQWDSLLERRIRMYGRECGCGREGHILMCHHPGKRATWTVIVSVLARYYKSIYYKTAFLPKYTGRFAIVYLSSSSENAPKSDPAALLLTFLAHLPFRILRKGISLHIFSGGTILFFATEVNCSTSTFASNSWSVHYSRPIWPLLSFGKVSRLPSLPVKAGAPGNETRPQAYRRAKAARTHLLPAHCDDVHAGTQEW